MRIYEAILFFQVFLVLIYQTIAGIYGVPQGYLIRSKREHGITGPVHTYVKTDKHANFKWGVRHHVGHHYSG